MNLNDLTMPDIQRIKMALAIARDRAANIAITGDHNKDKHIEKVFQDEAMAYQILLLKICE